jgi:hypothetical protein
MFVCDVKESTKKQVQVNTSTEISEMVTFNKMGQAIQWVHAIDYEKILQQMEAVYQIISQCCPDCMTENDNSSECPHPTACYIADAKRMLELTVGGK